MRDTVLRNRYAENRVVEIVKEFRFESAHFLNDYIGPCAHIHGHSYRLQVGVKGSMNPVGLVLDFKDLKELVRVEVIEKMDHQMLNHVLHFNPTAENMVVYLFDTLNSVLVARGAPYGISLVRLWETETSYAEYRGEDMFQGGSNAVLR